MKTKIVAEVKTMSPFGFKSDKTWDELFEIANEIGDVISIHVDPRWGGTPGDIDKARAKTTKPILAKGLDISWESAHEYLQRGADHILVHGFRDVAEQFQPGVCWYELSGPTGLLKHERFLYQHAYVVNARDPYTGNVKVPDDWNYVRRLHAGTLVQASTIEVPGDIYRNANYAIVGQHLPTFAKLWKRS